MTLPADSAWESELRALEDQSALAFLYADLPTLDRLWSDAFAVNSPLQKVLLKPQLLEALRKGRIRHLSYQFEIEHIARQGNIAIVMGNDRVTDPPDGALSHRRFTNIWHRDHGTWRLLARHAHVLARDPAPKPA